MRLVRCWQAAKQQRVVDSGRKFVKTERLPPEKFVVANHVCKSRLMTDSPPLIETVSRVCRGDVDSRNQSAWRESKWWKGGADVCDSGTFAG